MISAQTLRVCREGKPLNDCALRDADAWYRDLLEQMRRGNRRGWIGRELRPELRMGECGAEVGGRLPDRAIQIGRAFTDRAVKLRGDEARLALHEGGVILPDFEKALLIGRIEREHVHQHNRGWRRLRPGDRSERMGP